jgi:hypothetical protein
MKQQKLFKPVLCLSLIILIMLSAQVWSQSTGFRRGGLYGEWQVKTEFREWQDESILSFGRDNEGNMTGQWISFWGVNELKDVNFEENKLSFVQVFRFGENEFTQNFTGTVEDGKMTGMVSSDRDESKLEGKRSPRIPRAVGNWEMKYKVGERDVTSTLAVKIDKEGNLTAEWQSRWGEHEITDLQYERGNLTFKRKSKFQDRSWESTFEGTIERETNTLSGVFKSERGEITAEAKLIGAPLIGTWNLEIAFERITLKQRLRVNPDMSGLYGAAPIKKVNLEDDKVSFKTVLEVRDQKFEMSFEGKLAESKLAGELTTLRGTWKVTGTKVVRRFRRRSTT